MRNQVQLITYVDRFGGGNLADLHALLGGPLKGCFGGVHLLPFYDPIDGADAGYDPSDHTRVDHRLGDWGDVKRLSETLPVMADLIANHVSSNSAPFQDFMRLGADSASAPLFITPERVFGGPPTAEQLARIYRPRPTSPFTTVQPATGPARQLWTTFTSQQIDIDVEHPLGRAYLDSILDAFATGGVSMIRLDAAGYAIKRAGTSCFMLPETYAFIGDLATRARERGMESLVEIHGYYREQIDIARRVDRVYDFALPPLVLHALFQGTGRYLREWLAISPRNALTVLDTHDGIGVIDVGAASDGRPGLLPPAAIDALVEEIHTRSRGQSRQATGAAASNLDLYQVNCTYYDALGRDDTAYLIARALQFFAPGVPQVYYVGLLAGENDMALLERTSVGRDINRSYYTRAQIETALERQVVRALLALVRLRNEHPAFDGELSVCGEADEQLILEWQRGGSTARLEVDFASLNAVITLSTTTGEERRVAVTPAALAGF